MHSLIFYSTFNLFSLFGIGIFSEFIGIAIIGSQLNNIKIPKVILAIIFLISTTLHIAEIHFVSHKINNYFEDGYNILILIQSLSVFLFFKDTNTKKLHIISELSKYSYGIYLSHIIFLPLITDLVLKFNKIIHPVFILSIIIFFTTLLSYLFIKISHEFYLKIKYFLKRLIFSI